MRRVAVASEKLNSGIWLFLIFSFSIFPFVLNAQKKSKADFLIVKHPSSLVLYNKFQQRLTPDQLSILPSGIPFQISEDKLFLSDNYTPCLKVFSDGNLFFIEKNKNGTLVNQDKAKVSSVFSRAVAFSDTVEIITPQNNFPSSTKFVRVFETEKGTYSKSFSNSYLWIKLNPQKENIEWRKFKQAKTATGFISKDVLKQITSRLESSNRKLKQLFTYFNTKEQTQLPAPEWIVSSDGESIICEMKNGDPEFQFPQSARYISGELETSVLGTGYKIIKTGNGFKIQK